MIMQWLELGNWLAGSKRFCQPVECFLYFMNQSPSDRMKPYRISLYPQPTHKTKKNIIPRRLKKLLILIFLLNKYGVWLLIMKENVYLRVKVSVQF